MTNEKEKPMPPQLLQRSTAFITDLIPAAYNPRAISKPAIAGLQSSIQRFGLVQEIVVNKRNMRVVGGHQRLSVLKSLGHKKVPVVWVDLSERDEKALNVTLNSPAISGEFTDGLEGILAEIRDGDDPELYGELLMADLESLSIDGKEIIEDEVPAVPKTPVTKRGDLWKLGNHLLLCGDSTNAKDVAKALDGRTANMLWTDPPWNVAIGKDSNPRHRQREGLANDDLGKDFKAFLYAWAKACLPVNGGDLYCVMGAGEWPTVDAALRDGGMHWSATIVWVKDAFVLGRSKYHRRFEPIWYGWNAKGSSSFTGQRDVDDVWEVPRPKVSEDHPTMKPVELVAKAVNNSSKRGGLVFDPFTGGGSALVASEQLERAFSGIEIDPRYCDVIVERWQKLTDGKAKRV